MKSLVIIFALLVNGTCVLLGNEEKDCLTFSISFDQDSITNYSQLNKVTGALTNDFNQNIYISKYLIYGYYDRVIDYDDSAANLIWEVYKLVDSSYIAQKSIDLHPSFPLNTYINTYDTLLPDQTVTNEFNLFGIYQFTRGTYRIRAKLILPPINMCCFKEVYSNWLTFHILPEQL